MQTSRDTGTLGKAMSLLNLVAEAERPLRFSEILTLSGQPRGSVHRQLTHLAQEGLIELDAEGRYRPGLRLLSLASRAWASNELRLVAAPHLEALQRQTGETVHLGLMSGDRILYLDKIESRQPLRMYSGIGHAAPLYCTGVGKAALSVLPPERAAALINDMAFERFTPHTLAKAAMPAELAQIRACGHAFDREEHEIGIACVAAPFSLLESGTVGGLSVTGPAFRLTPDRLTMLAPSVAAAAAALTEDLRLRLGPRRA